MITWNSSFIDRKAFPKPISQVTKKSNFRSTISRQIRFTYGPKMMIRGFLYILYRWVKLSIIFCMWQRGKKVFSLQIKKFFQWVKKMNYNWRHHQISWHHFSYLGMKDFELFIFILLVLLYNTIRIQRQKKLRSHNDIVDLLCSIYNILEPFLKIETWFKLLYKCCFGIAEFGVVLKYQIISWKCFVSTM